MTNPDKSSSKGLKLYGGGKELTREEIEQAIDAYQKKRSTPEYRKEQEALRAFFAGDETPKDGVRYYKTTSGLIFRIDETQYKAYQFDTATRHWIETPYFYTDLHTGEVDAEEIHWG